MQLRSEPASRLRESRGRARKRIEFILSEAIAELGGGPTQRLGDGSPQADAEGVAYG